jgi:hypothetical protein
MPAKGKWEESREKARGEAKPHQDWSMNHPESSNAPIESVPIESASIESASIESAPIESGCAESSSSERSCSESSCNESGRGRYRVRAVDGAEHSAPDQVAGPRFERRDEAERYADAQGRISERSMIVEKLAAAGCWLPLGTVG